MWHKESKDLSKLYIDEFFGSLQNHEYKLNRFHNTSLENAFKTQMTFGRGRGRGNPRFKGRRRAQNNYQREERSFDQGVRRNQSLSSRGHNNNQA